ncbi:MAG: GuaB1 family IMP dehydrogenase-related protein [Pseudoclavibacter caeni]|jgi:IMP dehydrogenase
MSRACTTVEIMHFHGSQPQYDLTYSDVFLIPSRSAVGSRLRVDLSTDDVTGMRTPIVAANMNAVTGPRLASTMARRGGLAVLPQDMDQAALLRSVAAVKDASPRFAAPFLVDADMTVQQARRVLPPAVGHGLVVRDASGGFLGVIDATVLGRALDDALLGDLVHGEQPVLQVADIPDDETLFQRLFDEGLEFAVVLDGDRVLGTTSPKSAMRSTVYRPALDAAGRLRVAAAIGINGDVEARARAFIDAGVDVIVVDTAHGHQERMLEALRRVRSVSVDHPVVAGNVVTAQGVEDLVGAGANIVKVGVGPGAMCTTRMMTAVGRPQFSAVLETAAAARALGAGVWADGGVRYPRDVALALAAGGSAVMIGSWLAGTIESPGIIERDASGRLYKRNYGMASSKAVAGRFARLSPLERARKAIFSEGISDSRLYLDPMSPSVEDILDQITAGVRSACTYAGAGDLATFRERATVGIQSAAGYEEGRALPESW